MWSCSILNEPWTRGRHPERKGAANINRAFDGQCSPLHLDQALGDRQAETGPPESARCTGIGLPKLIEDGGLRLWRDAYARVGHADLDSVARLAHGALDVSLLREFDRIAHQVE